MRQGSRNGRVVHNTGRFQEDSTRTDDVWFTGPELVFGEQLNVESVLMRSFIKRQHALMLSAVGGNDEFSALLKCNVVVTTEIDGRFDPLLAKLRF